MDDAMQTRMMHFTLDFDLKSWSYWADKAGVDSRGIGFVNSYPNEGFSETEEVVEESFSLADKEKEFILKALEKYKGKRKSAAGELGISERTLYRKINEYNINL